MGILLVNQGSYSLPASLDACAKIRERVMQIANDLPFNQDDLDGINQAVGEAASNAVKHGSKNNPEAEVKVCCWTSECEMGIEITDQGDGFDPNMVPRPDFMRLPEGGMGIFYMREFMDSVDFMFDRGTTVILTKRFRKE